MFIVRWLAAILILPCTGVIGVPWVLLWLTRTPNWGDCFRSVSSPSIWAAGILALSGLALAIWTCSFFFRFGEGTAAPWDPPKRFVVRGPYRHVRNPMIAGIFLILSAEVLLFSSLAILAWECVFVLGNLLYIPLVEEKTLLRRFGAEYDLYRQHVPRWIPRLRAWKQDGPTDS